MFIAVVGNESSLVPAHKLYYLLGKTRGRPTNSNFELAWQALKNRYENKRKLINNQIRRIYDIQAPQSQSLKFLRLLQNTINDGLSVIRSFQTEIGSNDPFLMNTMCVGRLFE